MKPDRQTMIDRLVEDWLDSIAQEGADPIETMLRDGWKGYANMTDDEVQKDYAAAHLDEVYEEDEE